MAKSKGSKSSKEKRSGSSSKEKRSASSSKEKRSGSSSKEKRSASASKEKHSASSSKEKHSVSSSKGKHSASSSKEKHSVSFSKEKHSVSSSKGKHSASSSKEKHSASSSKEKHSVSFSKGKHSVNSSKDNNFSISAKGIKIGHFSKNKNSGSLLKGRHTAASSKPSGVNNRSIKLTSLHKEAKHTIVKKDIKTSVLNTGKTKLSFQTTKPDSSSSKSGLHQTKYGVVKIVKTVKNTVNLEGKLKNNSSYIKSNQAIARTTQIDNRFVATPYMVSDRQNKIDYSLKNFSEKIIKAANIVSINKKNPNKIEYSPFGNRYKTTKEIHFELKQAKSAIDGIPNNDLSKSIAKETLVALLEESGNSLVKNNHELGHLLTASAKKFSTASQISDLFEFVNYVSKDKMEKANEKLADISGGFVGVYVGAKIGARGGNLASLISGAILGGIGGTEEGRELLTSIVVPSKYKLKQGEFDNLENYAIQAEKMKQEMSVFNNKNEKNSSINPSSIIFDYPSITQDSTK